jgi:hypothetical protein
MCKIFMQMVMQRGFTWRGSHDNLFGFAKSVTAGRLAKESWLQRLHVKPSIARIQIEFFMQYKRIYILQYSALFPCKKHPLIVDRKKKAN